MFILLIASSESPTTLETIQGLATAAHTREHRIEIFFDAESVQLLNVKGGARNVANLVSQDIRLLACRTSAKELGMASPDDLADGVEMSSLGELAELLDACDRTVFIR